MEIMDAAIPTAIAAIMRALRTGLRRRLRKARRRSCMNMAPSSTGQRGDSRRPLQRVELMDLVDPTVDDAELAMHPLRELGIVRHHQNGGPCRIDLHEQLHDLFRHGRVQVPRRLVREDYSRISADGTRNR